MPDPNARRDKALEDIARSLKSIDRSLERISKNGRRTSFTNYQAGETSDGDTATTREGDESSAGPYGTGTTHPAG